MKNIVKFLSVILVVSLAVSILVDWYQIFIIDQYFAHASIFMSVLIGIGVPCAILLGAFQVIKLITKQ